MLSGIWSTLTSCLIPYLKLQLPLVVTVTEPEPSGASTNPRARPLRRSCFTCSNSICVTSWPLALIKELLSRMLVNVTMTSPVMTVRSVNPPFCFFSQTTSWASASWWPLTLMTLSTPQLSSSSNVCSSVLVREYSRWYPALASTTSPGDFRVIPNSNLNF